MGPYLFTKIERMLIKHWRSKGFQIFTYLDDGAGADQVLSKAMKMSTAVRRDIALSGFIANEEKSQWVPCPLTVGRTFGFYTGFADGSQSKGLGMHLQKISLSLYNLDRF